MSDREPCPVPNCGRQPVLCEGWWECFSSSADHVLLGPVDDPDGTKWDAMVRGMRQTPAPAPWKGRRCGECDWGVLKTTRTTIDRNHAPEFSCEWRCRLHPTDIGSPDNDACPDFVEDESGVAWDKGMQILYRLARRGQTASQVLARRPSLTIEEIRKQYEGTLECQLPPAP